jgi:hypothetical protein
MTQPELEYNTAFISQPLNCSCWKLKQSPSDLASEVEKKYKLKIA